jgi:peptidoglycan/xylan/chitin deacetylase (PgdA/CDA1 family)
MSIKRLLVFLLVGIPLGFSVMMVILTQSGAQAKAPALRADAALSASQSPTLSAPVGFEKIWQLAQLERTAHISPPPGNAASVRVPVLCYHRIDNVAGDYYHTTREMFEWQMKWLAENAQVISSAQLVNWVRYQQGLSTVAVELPANPVVIHFDDNYRSVHEIAWPILKRYKLPWTFFVYKHHHQPIAEKNLKEMATAGVDIQAHSMTHPWFHKPAKGQTMSEYIREMHWQIGGCKQYLEGISGRPVNQFAWPFGTYSDLAILLAGQYGFNAMFVADGGYVRANSSLVSLERVLVTKGWSKQDFINVVTAKTHSQKGFKPSWLLKDKEQARRLTAPKKQYSATPSL